MTEPNAEGIRTLTFEINGVMREIKVLDKHLEVKSDGKLKADKNNPFHLGSSIPGTVSKILVKEGEEVKKNQPLLTVEAMKMETSIVANQDGVIDKIYVKGTILYGLCLFHGLIFYRKKLFREKKYAMINL